MEIFIYILAGFFLTFAGIKLLLRWLLQKQIFDIPNDRSSHHNPTPVGGGIIITSVVLLLYIFYLLYNGFEIPWSYLSGALIVAVISWIDDLYSVSVILRFLCHSIAAVIVIIGMGINEVFYIPLAGDISGGYLNFLIWFLWIVWLINAYNFMDGIDGIAGTQALIAGIFWAILGFLYGNSAVQIFASTIAASSAAFLIFNWQPAKIFMGDVGSAFLGFTFAVFPLLLIGNAVEKNNYIPFVGVMFVWFFVFDSMRTLLLRMVKGEAIWKAHRRHIYQQLVIKGYSHSFVTIIYGLASLIISGLTVLWLREQKISDIILAVSILLLSAALAFAAFLLRGITKSA